MNSADLAVFSALMRTDLSSFLCRCMRTLNPDVTFLENWHIDSCSLPVAPGHARRGDTAHHQLAAALSEVDHDLSGVSSLFARA
jgi:hypothetical protein